MSASKFTAEARDGLLQRIAAGSGLEDACRDLGQRSRTVKGWLTRGRSEVTGEYRAFADAVDVARQAVKDRAPVMGERELARVISNAARAGSVVAMRMRWEQLTREEVRA